MKTIGLLYHPQRSDSVELANRALVVLEERGAEVWRGSAGDEETLRTAAPSLDVVITFGGDGTIVRCVRAIAHLDLPILGVNLGRLGFLAEIEPQQLEDRLPMLLEGRYRVEERMMAHSEVQRGDRILFQADAINEVVMARGLISRMVQIAIEVDGHRAMTVDADGVVLSTPTGSTAYCLSVGGPIVGPDLDCLIIAPIAAHLSLGNALVVPPTRHICLRLLRGEGAMLTVDGQIDIALKAGDCVHSSASQNTAQFVRFGGDGYFYESALRRLGWQERNTNH